MTELHAAEIDTRPGWGHAEDVVPIVAGLANRDAADPTVRLWAARAVADAGVPRGDVEGTARALLAAALRDIRYTDDPIERTADGEYETHELVQAPHVTLAMRAGDCVALAGLIGAGLQSLGLIPRYVVTALRPDQPRHITVEVQGPRGWYTVDPVPQPPRLGYDQHVAGAELAAWSAAGDMLPPDAVCVEPAPSGLSGLGRHDWRQMMSGAIAGYGLGLDEATEQRLADAEASWNSTVDNLESEYGDAVQKYGDAVRKGYDAAKTLMDSGASSEDVINAVAGSLAAAGALLAASIPAIGWIVGAAAEIAAAIIAGVNWLLSSYPAKAVQPTDCGVNLALRDLGYSARDMSGRGVLDLDTTALALAFADGWMFAPMETSPDSRDDDDTMRRLLAQELIDGWRDADDRCKASRITSDESGGPVEVAACVDLQRLVLKGYDRYAWIFGAAAFSRPSEGGAPRPFVISDTGEVTGGEGGSGGPIESGGERVAFESAWTIRETDLTGTIETWRIDPKCFAFRLDAMPDEMARAVKSALVAPADQWPADNGVRWVLRHIRGIAGDLGTDVTRESRQLLTYAMKWAQRPIGSVEVVAYHPLQIMPRGVSPVVPVEEAPAPEPPAEPQIVEPASAAAEPTPYAIPQGVSTEEAMVLAAIRYQDSVRQATRATAAARAFYGLSGCGSCSTCPASTICASLGVELPRLVNAAEEARLLATYPSQDALMAARDLRTRAAQVNYGLSHLGDTFTPSRAAERLMAWKKARGMEPIDSVVDETVRHSLSEDGGFELGAVPTLSDIASHVGTVAVPEGEAPTMVVPPGTLPPEEPAAPPAAPPMIPTETGLTTAHLPFAQPPGGVPAGGPEAGAPAAGEPTAAPSGEGGASAAFQGGAPQGAVMVAPPGTADVTIKTKPDVVTLVAVLLGLYYASKNRRRS